MRRFLQTLTALLMMIFLGGCNNDKAKDFKQQIRETLASEESAGEYSDQSIDAVFDIIRNTPEAMDCNAAELEALGRLQVVTSADSAVRAYTVLLKDVAIAPLGCVDSRTLLQYRLNGETYTAEYDERASYPLQIVPFGNDSYLLVTYGGCVSHGERFHQGAEMMCLREDGIHDIGSAFELDSVSHDTLLRSWEDGLSIDEDDPAGDMNWLEGCEGGISMWYNRFDSTLYVRDIITEVDDDYERHLRGNTFRRLRWDGDTFKDITIMEPYEVKNDNYYLRITQAPDGSCTYSSWNVSNREGAPALTIHGGTRQLWYGTGDLIDYNQWVTDDETPILGQKFTFVNNGFIYEYYTGYRSGETMECLHVTDPRGTLIYSGDFNKL